MTTATPDTAAPLDGAAGGGLRERSKARRRAAIQRTAMRLFAERGYDATTIADIAAAAEVAPRTVTGYFPSKVDLALSAIDETVARLTTTFAANTDADFLTVIDLWLTQEELALEPGLSALVNAMFAANPTLEALSNARIARLAEFATSALDAQIGLPRDHPMTAIGAAAVGAALSEYLSIISRSGASAAVHRSVMAFLRGVISAAKSA